jgi:nitrate reductase NapE component
MNSEIPESVVKKANNIISDARKAVLVGLIPILGIAFVGRLIEWYLLKRKCPILASDESTLAKDFRESLSRLWFAVLLWPIVILAFVIYVKVT